MAFEGSSGSWRREYRQSRKCVVGGKVRDQLIQRQLSGVHVDWRPGIS